MYMCNTHTHTHIFICMLGMLDLLGLELQTIGNPGSLEGQLSALLLKNLFILCALVFCLHVCQKLE